ncbi:hypothetical protein [Leadbetterella byssophila]|uniref:hypothetical protein n=1 Tax=Leadbetterella byssophila TaxID=316068 RepID=UPI0039A10079
MKYAYILLAFIFLACEKDEAIDYSQFTPGKLEATQSVSAIKFGESVVYRDLSTKVHRRNWVFPGGNPASSTDSEVTVTYPVGGSYKAALNITFIDNQKGSVSFDVEVEKDPSKELPEYDFGKTYGLYTESPQITPGLPSIQTIDMNQFPATRITDALEGVEALRFAPTGNSDWAMTALQAKNASQINISAFKDGFYNIAMKTECQASFLLRIRSANGGNAILEFTAKGEEYGLKRDGSWHLLSIPVKDILSKDPTLNLNQITDFFLFRSSPGDVRTIDNYVFYVDHIFMSEKVEEKK